VTILPLDPVAHASPEALNEFLSECRGAAAQSGGPILVSITIQVGTSTPWRSSSRSSSPTRGISTPSGPPRGGRSRAPSRSWVLGLGPRAASRRASGSSTRRWASAIAVGDQDLPFGGPHFFAAFTFLDSVGEGEPFEAACVFVPRWQVARRDGRTTAVANLLVEGDSQTEPLAAKVWRAHAKFRSFDFGSPDFRGARRPRAAVGDEEAAAGATRAP
jgi:menaquinone-specific isochorismate synthase